MNSMERVLATIQGKKTDRRAVSITLSLYGARLTQCPLSEYFTNPAAYARGQSAVRETFRPDVLFGPFALPLEGEAFGSQLHFLDNYPPNLARGAISSADEIANLAVPDIDSHPKLTYFRESIHMMAKEHGKEVPVAAIALDPIALPVMIMGLDGWLNTLLFDEEGRKRMLELTVSHFVGWANSLLADGATFIILPGFVATPAVITRKIAEQIVIPVLKEAYSQVKGPMVIHSTGAPLSPFIDLFAGLPNVAGFLLNGGEDIARARVKAGEKPVLIGNIEGPDLGEHNPEDIMSECLEILKGSRDDPHFILGSSGADVSFDTPLENIHALKRAAETEAEGNE
jgi:uroporphyrinogen decarboxylase